MSKKNDAELSVKDSKYGNEQGAPVKPLKEAESKGILHHPLTILFIGTLLGSLIIPYLNTRSNQINLLQEARLKKATDIVNQNTEINSQLNTLKTALGMFHSDTTRMKLSATEYKKNQKELYQEMNKRYLEFDRKAWWWYGNLLQEVSILKLASREKIEADIKAYGDNVGESTGVISKLWHTLVSPDYDPQDPKIEALLEETQKNYAELAEARRILIERIVRNFTD